MPARAVILIVTLAASLTLLGAVAAWAGEPAPGAPPQTRITFGPEGWTNVANPVFAYESSDPEARIECRLDGAPFAPCGPVEEEATQGPPDYRPLAQGRHVFEVRAVSLTGIADPTPARAIFKVDTESPTAEFVGGPFGVTHQRRPKFTIRVSGQVSFSCGLRGRGVRMKVPSCDGRHFFRPPRPLPDGHYEVTVRAVDRALNETENSGYFTVRSSSRHGEVP